MGNNHRFQVAVEWTGNLGSGTSSYHEYSRDHEIHGTGKPAVPGSSDAAFRGDAARYNPEELLIASLSTCHMLWYLHLCATNEIIVTAYNDSAMGEMRLDADGGGRFTSVTLRPCVKIAPGCSPEKALHLHSEANRLCFIANSVNFPVHHEARIVTSEG